MSKRAAESVYMPDVDFAGNLHCYKLKESFHGNERNVGNGMVSVYGSYRAYWFDYLLCHIPQESTIEHRRFWPLRPLWPLRLILIEKTFKLLQRAPLAARTRPTVFFAHPNDKRVKLVIE